jgi:hypothetical protein
MSAQENIWISETEVPGEYRKVLHNFFIICILLYILLELPVWSLTQYLINKTDVNMLIFSFITHATTPLHVLIYKTIFGWLHKCTTNDTELFSTKIDPY